MGAYYHEPIDWFIDYLMVLCELKGLFNTKNNHV